MLYAHAASALNTGQKSPSPVADGDITLRREAKNFYHRIVDDEGDGAMPDG